MAHRTILDGDAHDATWLNAAARPANGITAFSTAANASLL